jgi:GR25 family glycosyltransferase involved in LPS biosynthesis
MLIAMMLIGHHGMPGDIYVLIGLLRSICMESIKSGSEWAKMGATGHFLRSCVNMIFIGLNNKRLGCDKMCDRRILLGLIMVCILLYIGLLWCRCGMTESFVSSCGIQRYYMINLEDATQRWRSAKQQLAPYQIDLVRYPAVDTRTFAKVKQYRSMIDDAAMAKLEVLQQVKRRRQHRELSNGAVGCYLSHMGVYKQMIEDHVDVAMIMEDDIDIRADEVAKMSEICGRLPEGWDIILLGCINRDRPPHPIVNGFQRVDWFWGLHCYMIHIEAARRIVAKLLPIQYQIDYVLSEMNVAKELNIYRIMPEIVMQNRAHGTQIQVKLLTNDPKYIKRTI